MFSGEILLDFSDRDRKPRICLMTLGEIVSRFLRVTARWTPEPMPCLPASSEVSPPRFDGLAF